MSTAAERVATTERPSPDDASRPAPRSPRFPCLEGLRALAACMVVVHHSLNAAWPRSPLDPVALDQTPIADRFGHVMDGGVGIFFVLSGFLIYRPFVAAHLDGRPPMTTRSFWWRRFLRIVPAYWLALTFFWVLGNYELGSPSEAVRYYLFGQVFDRFTAINGIVPAWSLSVEVGFYLLVPLYAWALARLVRGRQVLPVEAAGVALLFATGYVFRAVVSAQDPSWREISFAWLPAQIDLFALGMGVAVLSAWAGRRAAAPPWVHRLGRSPELCWAAAAVIFSWYAIRIGPALFDTGYKDGFWQLRQATLGLITLLLLLPAVFGRQDRGPVRRALRWGPVVWIGTVSYGLYLWHLPWLDRLQTRANYLTGEVAFTGWTDGPVSLPLALATAFGLGLASAAVSWYLLERPLQRFKSMV